jgi:membrane associated rhomboid family serine protease
MLFHGLDRHQLTKTAVPPLPISPTRSVSTALMLVLIACFALQWFVVVYMGKPYDAYLALSGYGMKSGHLWELFTYQFFNRGVIHLLVNLVGLWFVGRSVEHRVGSRYFMGIYLGAVLAGGLLQGGAGVAGFLLPESQETVAAFMRDRFGGPNAGSSVGLCGIVAAWCLLNAGKKVVGPCTAGHLFWVLLTMSVVFVIVPANPHESDTREDLPYLGHLVGLITGAIVARKIRTTDARPVQNIRV